MSLQASLISTLAVVAGPVVFRYGFQAWRIRRLIEDTPTARIRSMVSGSLTSDPVNRSGWGRSTYSGRAISGGTGRRGETVRRGWTRSSPGWAPTSTA